MPDKKIVYEDDNGIIIWKMPSGVIHTDFSNVINKFEAYLKIDKWRDDYNKISEQVYNTTNSDELTDVLDNIGELLKNNPLHNISADKDVLYRKIGMRFHIMHDFKNAIKVYRLIKKPLVDDTKRIEVCENELKKIVGIGSEYDKNIDFKKEYYFDDKNCGEDFITWVRGIRFYDYYKVSLVKGEELKVVSEQNNPKDNNAIKVLTKSNIMLGYIGKEINKPLKKRLAKRKIEVVVDYVSKNKLIIRLKKFNLSINNVENLINMGIDYEAKAREIINSGGLEMRLDFSKSIEDGISIKEFISYSILFKYNKWAQRLSMSRENKKSNEPLNHDEERMLKKLKKDFKKVMTFYKNAINSYSKAAKLGNSSTPYSLMGQIYINIGFYEKALECFESGLSIEKDVKYKKYIKDKINECKEFLKDGI